MKVSEMFEGKRINVRIQMLPRISGVQGKIIEASDINPLEFIKAGSLFQRIKYPNILWTGVMFNNDFRIKNGIPLYSTFQMGPSIQNDDTVTVIIQEAIPDPKS